MHLNLRRPRALAAALLTCAAAVALPAAAHADSQSLNSVAITPWSSNYSLVFDVAGGSTANGAGVIQWYGNFGSNQRWNLVDQGDGTETIVNQNSGKCLTTDGVPGDQLYQFTCVGAPTQKWQSSLRSVGAYTSRIYNPASRLGVDVSGGSRWAGAKIITWYVGNGDNQEFAYYQL